MPWRQSPQQALQLDGLFHDFAPSEAAGLFQLLCPQRSVLPENQT